MTTTTIAPKPLRLWPGVAIAIVQFLVMFGAPVVAPDAELPIGLMAALGGSLLIVLWWLLLSRARWSERLIALVLMIAAVFAARSLAHESLRGLGQGFAMYFLPVQYFGFALVGFAVIARRIQGRARLALLAGCIVLAAAPWVMLRTPGVVGGSGFAYEWRWTPTAEDVLLARGEEAPKPLPPAPAETTAPATVAAPVPEAAPASASTAPEAPQAQQPSAPAAPKAPQAPKAPTAPSRAEWPGFRGPNRDSVIRTVRIKTDWAASPPAEVWRRPVGPGWSSFAVDGDLFYTQEQRGEEELVSCYRVSTGELVWRHKDPVRFWEANGGAGPRSTPTLSDGRVYASGATGILNALDARSGKLLWSHHVAKEAKVELPIWGFTASPLVIDDLVIAATSGAVAAYDRVTGERRWLNSSKGGSYSSPHRVTIDGVEQVVFLAGPGAMSFSPADGRLLWEHKFEGGPIVQPGIIDGNDLIVNAISPMGGIATRRVHVAQAAGAWTVTERWTERGLKPYFNDFVIHKGHAYGFDGSILASINLENGTRNWKGGRYGNGQMILLADQDLLLVLSEEGEIALVSATTDKYTEVAKVPALNAKTWNHPVLVGDTLLVRNGEEMVAFKIALDRPQPTER